MASATGGALANIISGLRLTPRWILRNATAGTHARLDALVEAQSFTRRAGYESFLTASAQALSAAEHMLEASGVAALVPDWPSRRRMPALEADLAGLGVRLPAPLETPAAPYGRDAMLGALYVLEGSRLGARVLLKRAQDSADPAIAANTRYLSHGAGARLWQTFLETLEADPSLAAHPEAAVRAAEETFALFEAAFSGVAEGARA